MVCVNDAKKENKNDTFRSDGLNTNGGAKHVKDFKKTQNNNVQIINNAKKIKCLLDLKQRNEKNNLKTNCAKKTKSKFFSSSINCAMHNWS